MYNRNDQKQSCHPAVGKSVLPRFLAPTQYDGKV
jgi:hypothetical protein